MSNHRVHDRHLDKAIIRPSELGLVGILIAAKEVNIFNPDGTIRRQPDLVFIDNCGVVSIGEYQCTNNHKERAYHQLHDSAEVLEDSFGVTPEQLYIYGDMRVERR